MTSKPRAESVSLSCQPPASKGRPAGRGAEGGQAGTVAISSSPSKETGRLMAGAQGSPDCDFPLGEGLGGSRRHAPQPGLPCRSEELDGLALHTRSCVHPTLLSYVRTQFIFSPKPPAG